MKISVEQAKKMGIWEKIPSEAQKELKKKPRQKQDSEKDPQLILYKALKARLPEIEWEVNGLVPNRRFRVDIFIPETNIIVEFDGFQFHALRPCAYQNTLKRQNLLVAEGYSILRYYTKQVFSDLDSVIEEILSLHKKKLAQSSATAGTGRKNF